MARERLAPAAASPKLDTWSAPAPPPPGVTRTTTLRLKGLFAPDDPGGGLLQMPRHVEPAQTARFFVEYLAASAPGAYQDRGTARRLPGLDIGQRVADVV